jgi:hypothetical protein
LGEGDERDDARDPEIGKSQGERLTVLAPPLAAGPEGATAKSGSPAWLGSSRLMFWSARIVGVGCG